MAIGFVPVFDLDFSASALDISVPIELDDDKARSGENWVWDNTTHTLSLYNAKITQTNTGNSAIQYNGTEMLKINQIGYNLIENGYIEASKIEVVGSGILDFNVSSAKMFKTSNLTLSNGYITSNNAASLLYNAPNASVTISNCVLDIPNSKTELVTTFTMNSGYVTASKLSTSTNYLNGGYIKLTSSTDYTAFSHTTTTFGHAVVQGECILLGNGTDSDFTKFDLNNSIVLVKKNLQFFHR